MAKKENDSPYMFTVANTETNYDTPVNVNTPQSPTPVGNPKEKRGLKGWSMFFFILSCISLVLVSMTFILPILAIIIGLLSLILWLIAIVFGTIITLGLIWLSDETKAINAGWMGFNEWIFGAGGTITEYAGTIIPIVTWVGAGIFVLTWILMISGLVSDKQRHKRYKGLTIALTVLTILYIVCAIFTVVAYGSN